MRKLAKPLLLLLLLPVVECSKLAVGELTAILLRLIWQICAICSFLHVVVCLYEKLKSQVLRQRLTGARVLMQLIDFND
jgi:hypothetical protein